MKIRIGKIEIECDTLEEACAVIDRYGGAASTTRGYRLARNQEIATAYAGGEVIPTIAARFGLHPIYVRILLRQMGQMMPPCPPRPPRPPRNVERNVERNARIAADWNSGLTLQKIGDAHGLTGERVRMILNKSSIDTSPSGRYSKPPIERVCACGCGEKFTVKYATLKKRHINMSHAVRDPSSPWSRVGMVELVCGKCGDAFRRSRYIESVHAHTMSNGRKNAYCPACSVRRPWLCGRVGKTYTLDGFTGTIRQWAARTGISGKSIHQRIRAGMPLRAALTTPKMKSGRRAAGAQYDEKGGETLDTKRPIG